MGESLKADDAREKNRLSTLSLGSRLGTHTDSSTSVSRDGKLSPRSTVPLAPIEIE